MTLHPDALPAAALLLLIAALAIAFLYRFK